MIAVLLPCRERGNRATKQWLRRLQNYLATSHAKNSRRENVGGKVKIVTIFTCRARNVFASISGPKFSGVLSFQPRKFGKFELDQTPKTLKGTNVTDFMYCEDQSLNMLQMARLGKRLSAVGRISIVYTYSPGSAGAMKLLSSLILHGKLDVVGAASTADISTALDDAQSQANSNYADSVLYIGGPPRLSEACSTRQNFLSQNLDEAMDQFVASEKLPDGQFNEALQSDCDCRQWAFQFLQPKPQPTVPMSPDPPEDLVQDPEYYNPEDVYYDQENSYDYETPFPTTTTPTTTSSTTAPSITELTSTITTSTSTTSTSATSSSTTTTSTTSTSTEFTTTSTSEETETRGATMTSRVQLFMGDPRPKNEIPSSIYIEEGPRKDFLWNDGSQVSRDVQEDYTYSPAGSPQSDIDQFGCLNEKSGKFWKILSIGISILGLITVVAAFVTLIVYTLRRDVPFAKHQVVTPVGFIFMFLTVAVLGMDVSTTSCALKRILPGLALTTTFTGIICQLLNDMAEKNVYIVNKRNRSRHFDSSRRQFSRDDKLVAFAAGVISVQVMILAVWNLVISPQGVCSSSELSMSYLECKAVLNFGQFFSFAYAYPIFLSGVACLIGGLTIKWRTQSGGTGCLVSTGIIFSTWIFNLMVHTTYSTGDGYNSVVQISNKNVLLLTHTVASVVLLVTVYLPRLALKIRNFQVEPRELEMTSNSTIPDNGVSSVPNTSLSLQHELHSTLNRSYTNTYSSCSSFKLPSIMAMPEASAWQELCRWEFGAVNEEEEGSDEVEPHTTEWRTTSSSQSTTSGEEENRSDITQLDRDNRIILLRAPASTTISNI